MSTLKQRFSSRQLLSSNRIKLWRGRAIGHKSTPTSLQPWLPCRSSTAAAGKGFGVPVKKAPARKGLPKRERSEFATWEVDKKLCPCGSGSGNAYKDCCGPFIDGTLVPPTAEALMRSRFSAYVKNEPQYIVKTTHPDNPAAAGSRKPDGTFSSALLQDASATCKKTRFLKLKVLSTEHGAHEDEAYVTFRYDFKFVGQNAQRQQGTRLESETERSRFVREGGRWLYIEGETSYKGHIYNGPSSQ